MEELIMKKQKIYRCFSRNLKEFLEDNGEEIDRMNNDIEKYNAKYKVRMEQINKFNFSL